MLWEHKKHVKGFRSFFEFSKRLREQTEARRKKWYVFLLENIAFKPGITWARFAEMNFQPGFSTNDHCANDLDHPFPVIWWLFFFFALMQLDGLLYLYILFRRRNINFFVGYCARMRNLMLARCTPQSHGKFSAPLAGIPASRYWDLGSPGWRGCLVIASWFLLCFTDSRDLGKPSQPGSCN